MKKIEIPVFQDASGNSDKEQLFKFLKANKSLLMAEKSVAIKYADAVSYGCPVLDVKTKAFKTVDAAESMALLIRDEINAKLAINATNILDTHGDVHLPGLWKKCLKENAEKMLHLKMHVMDFDTVIADGLDGDVKAYTEMISWKELGFDFKGTTEVLLFESIIRKARNEQMFNNYAKGYVKQHSVGMRYVKYLLCINSEERYYFEEKDAWDEYYKEIVNKDVADERGWFWAVTEAKAFEGSAVPRGSNYATPTIEMKSEPGNHSGLEPLKNTPVDYSWLLANFKL